MALAEYEYRSRGYVRIEEEEVRCVLGEDLLARIIEFLPEADVPAAMGVAWRWRWCCLVDNSRNMDLWDRMFAKRIDNGSYTRPTDPTFTPCDLFTAYVAASRILFIQNHCSRYDSDVSTQRTRFYRFLSLSPVAAYLQAITVGFYLTANGKGNFLLWCIPMFLYMIVAVGWSFLVVGNVLVRPKHRPLSLLTWEEAGALEPIFVSACHDQDLVILCTLLYGQVLTLTAAGLKISGVVVGIKWVMVLAPSWFSQSLALGGLLKEALRGKWDRSYHVLESMRLTHVLDSLRYRTAQVLLPGILLLSCTLAFTVLLLFSLQPNRTLPYYYTFLPLHVGLVSVWLTLKTSLPTRTVYLIRWTLCTTCTTLSAFLILLSISLDYTPLPPALVFIPMWFVPFFAALCVTALLCCR